MTGCGFVIWHKEHEKKATAPMSTSRFYRRYRSIKCTYIMVSSNSNRKGYFENLIQYIGIGFEMENIEVVKIIKCEEEGKGLFLFNANKMQRFDKLNMQGRNTVSLKVLDLVAYLIELAYDLVISPMDNVSENPGFDSCIDIW